MKKSHRSRETSMLSVGFEVDKVDKNERGIILSKSVYKHWNVQGERSFS